MGMVQASHIDVSICWKLLIVIAKKSLYTLLASILPIKPLAPSS